MYFKKWILQFVDEDSPRGDLAYDIKHDQLFPTTQSKKRILEYLDFRNACRECIEAFEEAWEEFKMR